MSVETYLKSSKRDIFQWECEETTDGYGMGGVQSESVHIEDYKYKIDGSITKESDNEFEVDVILNYPIVYDDENTYEVIDYRSNRKSARLLVERLIKNDLKKDIIVSDEQLNEMKHALGLDYKRKPYRNRFNINSNDEKWNDLVNKKLACKGDLVEKDGNCYFWLTKFGAEYAYGKSMSDKFYKEL